MTQAVQNADSDCVPVSSWVWRRRPYQTDLCGHRRGTASKDGLIVPASVYEFIRQIKKTLVTTKDGLPLRLFGGAGSHGLRILDRPVLTLDVLVTPAELR